MAFSRLTFLLACSAALWACDDGPPPGDLPPDPGSAGEQTLAGIDSDDDGIRDDVQIYIAQTYEDAPTRAALTQTARAMLDGIEVSADQAASLDNLAAMTRGIECTFSVRGDDASEALGGLRDVVVNTRARLGAFLALDAQAGGGTFIAASDPATSCL